MKAEQLSLNLKHNVAEVKSTVKHELEDAKRDFKEGWSKG